MRLPFALRKSELGLGSAVCRSKSRIPTLEHYRLGFSWLSPWLGNATTLAINPAVPISIPEYVLAGPVPWIIPRQASPALQSLQVFDHEDGLLDLALANPANEVAGPCCGARRATRTRTRSPRSAITTPAPSKGTRTVWPSANVGEARTIRRASARSSFQAHRRPASSGGSTAKPDARRKGSRNDPLAGPCRRGHNVAERGHVITPMRPHVGRAGISLKIGSRHPVRYSAIDVVAGAAHAELRDHEPVNQSRSKMSRCRNWRLRLLCRHGDERCAATPAGSQPRLFDPRNDGRPYRPRSRRSHCRCALGGPHERTKLPGLGRGRRRD